MQFNEFQSILLIGFGILSIGSLLISLITLGRVNKALGIIDKEKFLVGLVKRIKDLQVK